MQAFLHSFTSGLDCLAPSRVTMLRMRYGVGALTRNVISVLSHYRKRKKEKLNILNLVDGYSIMNHSWKVIISNLPCRSLKNDKYCTFSS